MTKLLAILLVLVNAFANAQVVSLQLITSLPSSVSETSGLASTDSTSIWTHNDSGGSNKLYKIDFSGNIIDTITISNAANFDWEDLAQDDDHNFYIGDFSNNTNDRTDLKIYKIKNPDLFVSGLDTAQVISFSYSDQQSFPPSSANLNFDCEAFFHFGDSLYLFSKNISNPNDGFSKLYRLPDSPGNYVAELMDSFYTLDPVTSADIFSDGSKIVLLTYLSVIIFKDYAATNFFNGNSQKIGFSSLSQKEAILFEDENHVFLSDEKFYGIGGNLYRADLTQWLPASEIKNHHSFFFVYPNPSSGHFTVAVTNHELIGKEFIITNLAGQKLMTGIFKASNKIDLLNSSQPCFITFQYQGKIFSAPLVISLR